MKTLVYFFFFALGVTLGVYLEKETLLKPIEVKISQDGQSGALPPVMVNGELTRDSVATDTVLHGGQLYTPTKYYYTYQINLKKFIK